MDGEALLRRCCEKVGLDFDSIFYFKKSQVSLHPGRRITQSYISSAIKDIDYIVRYYPDNDIFFVWHHIRGRNSCSFAVPKDYKIQSGTIRKDTKIIGDGSKRRELVFSFSSTDTMKFLEEIIKNGL